MSDTAERLKTAVIVEDDPDIRHLLADVLESAGFSTVSVANGIDGVRAVVDHQPLLTTLDVNMPGIDGFEAARRIRRQSDTYIIMLTGLEEEADVVLGLGAGADEYVVKPFRPRELRARIEALLRRPRVGESGGAASVPEREGAGQALPATHTAVGAPVATEAAVDARPRVDEDLAPSDGWLAHRDLHLDPESRLVRMAGEELDLTRTEFDLLAALMESRRRVRSKADLTLVLRGESYVTSYFVGDADKRAIEAHMTNLRRKLGDNPANPRYIETVRGVGYRMTSESSAS
ncbi:response regulator transcription factor [Microbacterium sp. 22296]|uniref:response regulator transcription factor n=1 Tax=Microbacterium sp. 22296 TaxID=3453903 RepID=UPI003F8414A8